MGFHKKSSGGVIISACCLMLVFLATPATAGSLTGDPAATYWGQQSVTYPQYSGFVGNTQIISKEFTDLGPINNTFTWTGGEQDFDNDGGGFRWFEYIQNNSGATWTEYTVVLSNTGGTWRDAGAGIYIPGAGSSDFATGTYGTVTTIFDLDSSVASITGQTLTFDLSANPVASGGILQIHTNMKDMGTAGGTFNLSQSATGNFGGANLVPIPSAALLGAFGLGLLGVAQVIRRRRQARS